MKKQLLYIVLLIILIASFACKKDFDYPLIQTGEVTDIDSTGAVFHGKIINLGEEEIIDYGFVWNKTNEPKIENSYIKSLGKIITDGLYNTEINSAFIEGTKYYVRAYIKNKSSVVYGREVSFISLGSKAPSIISYTPNPATWGDTIKIIGENFSNKNEENKIKFSNFSSNPIRSSDIEIITTVPYELNNTPVDLSISVLENITIANEKFCLIKPEIHEFTPLSGTYQTTVEILGKYFHPSHTEVYFNSIKANIISISFSSISVEVPSGLPPGEVDLSVIAATQEVISDIKFNSLSPDITGFIPTSGTFGDEITIQGNNFSTEISENTVKFGEIEATVTQANENLLKALVPNFLSIEKSKISVTINEQTDISDDDFTLLSPVIESFSPKTGTFGDEIIIVGQNFNPLPNNNIVKFGNTIANVTESSNNEIKALVPNDFYSTTGKTNIIVEIGETFDISEDEFELLLHIIDEIVPNYGCRGDTITIDGLNFNPVPDNNKVFFGGTEVSVLSSSHSALSVLVPEGFEHNTNLQIKVKISNRDVIAEQTFIICEPWNQIATFPGDGRQVPVRFALNGKGYIGVGGDKYDLWEYDPSTNVWTYKISCPVSGTGNSSFATTTKGYFVKGENLWQYDPVLNTWSSKANFPGEAEWGQFGFAVGNKGYVGTGVYYEDNGGGFGEYISTNELWEYDELNDSWTQKANFPGIPTHSGSAFTIENSGYFVFGEYTANPILWEYNTITDEWSYKMNLSDIVENINNGRKNGVSMSINGKGYFGIGHFGSDSNTQSDFYEYDPIQNSCRRIVGMFNPRTSSYGLTINNIGYIGLGYHKVNNFIVYLNDCWEFDPSKLKP